jgi:tmRNA-binding protein
LENLNFENIQTAVSQMQHIFPNLKALQISLSEEQDVSYIMQNMNQLEVLNGIKVIRHDDTMSNDVTRSNGLLEKTEADTMMVSVAPEIYEVVSALEQINGSVLKVNDAESQGKRSKQRRSSYARRKSVATTDANISKHVKSGRTGAAS